MNVIIIMKSELNFKKKSTLSQSSSVNNSRSSLASNKFHFEKPFNILWKPSKLSKKNPSTENILELSDTCMFNEELQSSRNNSISVESQTETLDTYLPSISQDYDLIAEIKALRSEVNELKNSVRELQFYKIQFQIKDNHQTIINLEKENEIIKKTLRPPLPIHRQTKSNNFL